VDKHGAGFSTGTERELTCPARGGSGSEPDPRGPAPTGRRYMSESEEVGAHHMADVDCRPWTESASQTGPAPEPDMTSRTERELTRPVRGGSGSEPDPRGPSPTGRRYMSESEEVGAHHMADVDRRPWTESASQTGPAPEPDMASTSRTERELTRPVRGGSGSEPDPQGRHRRAVTTYPT
jgi:hypothetical protein